MAASPRSLAKSSAACSSSGFPPGNAGALDRDKQLAVVAQFTDLVAKAAGDLSLAERTWVLLTEAVDGGWGLWGHARTNAELVQAARDQIAKLTSGS